MNDIKFTKFFFVMMKTLNIKYYYDYQDIDEGRNILQCDILEQRTKELLGTGKGSSHFFAKLTAAKNALKNLLEKHRDPIEKLIEETIESKGENLTKYSNNTKYKRYKSPNKTPKKVKKIEKLTDNPKANIELI